MTQEQREAITKQVETAMFAALATTGRQLEERFSTKPDRDLVLDIVEQQIRLYARDIAQILLPCPRFLW